MPSFSFVITEKCNWNCSYCYFTNIKQKGPNINVFKKHLPYIKNIIDRLDDLVVNIDIQGGEVGTIPIDILEYFFQTIRKKIVVSTNGLFLEKKFHLNDKIRPFINSIMWHVTDDFKKKIPIDYNDDEIHISKGIVHDNINEMISFIKINSNIIFDYVEFEFDINQPRKMDLYDYKKLLGSLEGLRNVTKNAKDILRRRLQENLNHRDNCRKYNHSILIDLVNENICLCQRQLNSSIPLNEDNLIYRLKTFPKDVFKNDSCYSCTRLYAGKFYGNVIERAIKTRNVLNE